jgi:2'-5' RNA ligase
MSMVAYWLMPASESRDLFSSIIRQLAEQYDAPVFAPHVTLYVSNDDRTRAAAALANAAAQLGEIALEVDEISWSQELAKSVFVQFQPNDKLARLSDVLRKISSSGDKYDLNPHLTLIYQELPIETKEEIASAVSLPFTNVLFDSIQAMDLLTGLRSPADVKTWEVIGVESLK